VGLNGVACFAPLRVQAENEFGVRWNGEEEALNRLIGGIGFIPESGAKVINLTPEQIVDYLKRLYPHTYEDLILPAAPIQDAIALAKFLVETTIGFIRFAVARPKTVGGPIEIAVHHEARGFQVGSAEALFLFRVQSVNHRPAITVASAEDRSYSQQSRTNAPCIKTCFPIS
jgi:hypothetical protein